MLLRFKPAVENTTKHIDSFVWSKKNDFLQEVPDELGQVLLQRDERFSQVVDAPNDDAIDDDGMIGDALEEDEEELHPLEGDDD